jgi:hypothetical protein
VLVRSFLDADIKQHGWRILEDSRRPRRLPYRDQQQRNRRKPADPLETGGRSAGRGDEWLE